MAKPAQQQDIAESVQTNINRSMDTDFDVLATEMLGYDGTNLQRIKTDTAGKIQVDVDMATEDIATEATLAKLTGLSGAGVDTTLTLTNANTAYACPASAPTSAYTLIIYNASDTDVYFRFTTGTTAGVKIASGQMLRTKLAASVGGFVYCASAGKVINVSTKIA